MVIMGFLYRHFTTFAGRKNYTTLIRGPQSNRIDSSVSFSLSDRLSEKDRRVYMYGGGLHSSFRQHFHSSPVCLASNPYEILGLSRGASQQDIKKRFKELAKQNHPDLNPNSPDAKQKMADITAAYEQLSNAEKKQFYDRTGMTMDEASQAGGFQEADNNTSSSSSFMFSDFAEMFSRMSGSKSSPFGSGTGSVRGEDIQTHLSIDFMSAMKGCEKTISITRQTSCITCNGKGAAPGTSVTKCKQCAGTGITRVERGPLIIGLPCTYCSGSGEVIQSPCKACNGVGVKPYQKTMQINIPAGVRNGMEIRVPNEGNAGIRGGRAGHLFATVTIKPHPIFRAEDDDLHVDVDMTVKTCLLGGEIEIPTLTGPIKMKLGSRTPPGSIKVLKGKGCPRIDQRGNGNLLVRLKLKMPRKITERQKELLEEFNNLSDNENGCDNNNNNRSDSSSNAGAPPPPPPN